MKLPTYFISHGGGPWPYLSEMAPTMHTLAQSLADIPCQLGETPKVILMVTAHWEASAFTLGTHPRPGMLYDYGGFPAHTYQVVYPALGAPALAPRVQDLLHGAGLPVALDGQRGYDHGTFVPLAVMYPKADVPVLQMSLRTGLDPAEHIALGRALAPLRDEGVLIVCSGLSYHNLRAFGPLAKVPSKAFDDWLQSTMAADAGQRVERLLHWAQAPAARLCHPREEHLLPLMVALGAAEAEPAACIYHEDAFVGGVAASSFRFGTH
jgi:aromatic ring-opening dioxygenase catalytic subunit (LigB family)